MEKKMKAVVMEKYGHIDELKIQEMPVPAPSKNEILVKVHASSFNPADYSLLMGKFGEILNLDSPHILGLDVSGVVINAHESVRKFKVGDQVYAYVSIVKNGSYGEYMVINENDVALMPKDLSFHAAAATPLASLTALQGLYELGELKENETILIRGASGAVGIFAIQLALLKGAKIYASCSEASKDLIKEYPLEKIIDYKKEKESTKIPEKLDLIYNLAPMDQEKLNELLSILKKGGRLVSTLGFPETDENTMKTYHLKAEKTKRGGDRLREITSLIEDGKLVPEVTSLWSLDQVKELFSSYEKHELYGKAVITIYEKK